MKPIAIYSRVSTTDQNFDSQVEDLKKWCKANNFKVIKSFGEKISGYDPDVERKEYEAMKQYVLENNIKDIAVWEISRLSRSMVRTVTEIDFFTANKINIHFKREGIESLSDNATNRLLITILSSMAEMERNTFLDRGARGRMSAVLKGRMIGYSTPPYGYTSDDKGIIMIEPTEAKTIELIYDLALKGISLYGIASHLNSLKIPTRHKLQGKVRTLKGGKEIDILWKPVVISRLIKKPIYKGVRIYTGKSIPIPAIVSETIWDKAQKRFAENIGHLNKSKYPILFKGKIRCGKCGRTFVTYHNKVDQNSYYLCTGLVDVGLKCQNGRYINANNIDNNLYTSLFDHKYIKEILTKDSSDTKSKDEKVKQIDYFKGEIASFEGQIKRHKKLYTDGYASYEEMSKEIATLKGNIIETNSKISVLEKEITTIEQVDIEKIIKTYKNASDYEVKRDFVVKYVNSITLNKVDIANVEWKNPLHKNEKIIYIEMFAFGSPIPIKILITPFSKNVIISRSLQYLPDFNTVIDIDKKV